MSDLRIDFLYFEDCPSHPEALERLRDVLAEEGIEAEIAIDRVETEAQARRLRFVGSPTILVNGQDVDPPDGDAYVALTCRVYRHEDGRFSPLPSKDAIRRALRAAQTNAKGEENA